MLSSWSSAFAVVLTGAVALLAQQQPTFRSQANYIEVDAIVTDGSGRFVPGLTATDFEIREERRPQAVTAFSLVDMSGAAAPTAPVAFRPDTPQAARIDASRVYLLYLSAVPTRYLSQLRQQAGDFVRSSVQPGDVAAVWDDDFGADDVTITNDKEHLLRRIAGFGGIIGGAGAGSRIGQSGLGTAIDWLSAVQGRRKSLIMFAAGWLPCGSDFAGLQQKGELERLIGVLSGDSRIFDSRDGPSGNVTICGTTGSGGAMPALIDLLQRSDIHIYACDVRGLVTLVDLQRGGDGQFSLGDLAAADRRAITNSVENLRTIADATGGLAIVNTNDYAKGFARIVEDNSRYYLLGYESSGARGGGVFRSLDVRVKRPGLTVRARKGYFAR